MKTIKIKDREFELFIPNGEIETAISRMAAKMNRELAELTPLFIGVLNGTFMFAADLLKKITIPCEITFLRLSSYSGIHSTKQVKEIIGLENIVKNRNIIILEDIIDSGLTIDYIINKLIEKNPASIKVGTMFFKPSAFKKNFIIDYIGIEIPNYFIVGYGLDYDGQGRNLPDVYKLKEE
ncbi:MAG TPA: hypoxanthine phosphoribosyltransferase [Bacteroidales bacterium]|nr:hypoxanthine phosphoribosyltransferase [Bacteroidales bacterium]